MSSEIEVESVPGLPHDLPPGERILWQGRPHWKAMARHSFKVRALAAYFAVFAAARFALALELRQGAVGARQLGQAVLLAAACLGVLSLMAWLNARATIYTITTRRVVMRVGVALPMTWNLPFARLAGAQLKTRREGDGDIVLQLKAPDRIAWLQLWPHAQPWHLLRARPALRTIPDAGRVALLLASAVKGWADGAHAPIQVGARGDRTETVPDEHGSLVLASHHPGVATEEAG